jgi:hypothetical protein
VDVITRPAVGPVGPTSAIASWISVLPYASETGPERQMRNMVGLRFARPFLSASIGARWVVFLTLAISTGPRSLVDGKALNTHPGSLSPTSVSAGWIHAAPVAAACTGPQRLLLDAVLLYMLWPFNSASTCAGWVLRLQSTSHTSPIRHVLDVVLLFQRGSLHSASTGAGWKEASGTALTAPALVIHALLRG